jgi:DNA-directed RNA polymerase subunit RPC12/RpoP
MKLLSCLLCRGEMDIIGSEHSINKKVRCQDCGYSNIDAPAKKEPEILVMRKRPLPQD